MIIIKSYGVTGILGMTPEQREECKKKVEEL